jgi:uncharacterized MAPEG superfamily protein
VRGLNFKTKLESKGEVMSIAFYCVLIAAFLPIVWTGIAKFSGPGFNNFTPRDFQAGLSGMRQRAHWAHLNSFEAFPPFAAAVLIAHAIHGANATIDALAMGFIAMRILYGVFYMLNWATPRSVVWFAAVLCWVAMYFQKG